MEQQFIRSGRDVLARIDARTFRGIQVARSRPRQSPHPERAVLGSLSLPCRQYCNRYAHFLYPLSIRFVQGVLKPRNDANYRPVPKRRSRTLLPMRASRKQNRFVPVEPFLNAAIWLRLRRYSTCTILQFQRHDMLRVPKLTRAPVCNSSERAATRWPPVRCEDRLPYDKHTHLAVGVPRQQLLSCGGPPQTSWSSRRQQQDQARNVGLGIECLLELLEISFRQCDNRFLPVWR
jgi:hypothetical protein